jgi:putative peptidoglycan lipid II flippase
LSYVQNTRRIGVMKKILHALMRQERILGGAAVLASLQLCASIAGLVRDRTLYTTFTDKGIVDAFIASFKVSDLLFQMFIMSAFSVALVPMLVEKRKNSVKAEANLLYSVTIVATTLYVLLGVILWLLMPWIAKYSVQFTESIQQIYITNARLAIVSNALFVIGNAFGQLLISRQRYVWYGITPILYTVSTIVGTVFLSTENTFGVYGPMVGNCIGAVLYTIIRMVVGIHVLQILPQRIRYISQDFQEIFFLMLPRVLALGALQTQLLLFDTFASSLPSGSVTINAFARNFQSVVVGVVGIALAQSTFALLSKSYSEKNIAQFWQYLRKGLYTMFALTIPASLALIIASPIAAYIIGLPGSTIFMLTMAAYTLSIPFESANHLVTRAYYSAKHSIIPSLSTVLIGVISIAITMFTIDSIGIFALPLGFATAQILLLIFSVFALQRIVTKKA